MWNKLTNEKYGWKMRVPHYQIPSTRSAIIFPCLGMRPDVLRDLKTWPTTWQFSSKLLELKSACMNDNYTKNWAKEGPLSSSACSLFINFWDSGSTTIARWSFEPLRRVRGWAAYGTEDTAVLFPVGPWQQKMY